MIDEAGYYCDLTFLVDQHNFAADAVVKQMATGFDAALDIGKQQAVFPPRGVVKEARAADFTVIALQRVEIALSETRAASGTFRSMIGSWTYSSTSPIGVGGLMPTAPILGSDSAAVGP